MGRKDGQSGLLQKVHGKYVDDALFLMVAHDVNPRAISPRGAGSRISRRSGWRSDIIRQFR
jgi:hypothetical protein